MGENFCRKRKWDPAAPPSLPLTSGLPLTKADTRMEARGQASILFVSLLPVLPILCLWAGMTGSWFPPLVFWEKRWILPQKEAPWWRWRYLQRASLHLPQNPPPCPPASVTDGDQALRLSLHCLPVHDWSHCSIGDHVWGRESLPHTVTPWPLFPPQTRIQGLLCRAPGQPLTFHP